MNDVITIGPRKKHSMTLTCRTMLKDVSDGFSIPPGFGERKGHEREREREQDVEQSEKNPKNPFILSDHWLSARINRN